MQIRVEGVVPEGSNINISCCDQSKVIDTLDKSTTFDVSKPDNLILYIEEKESKSNHSIGYIIKEYGRYKTLLNLFISNE